MLLVVFFAFCALYPISPRYLALPNQDSGVFLYIGRAILEGNIPYKDVWDHKPPGIYFVDAIGLAISGGSRWGVWSLELISLTSAGLLSLLLLRRYVGIPLATMTTLVWMAATLYIFDDNMTEAFALPLQFAAIYLFFNAEQKRCYGWRGWLIGATGMLAFLLRPNVIGLWVSIFIFIGLRKLITKHQQPVFRDFTSIAAGCLVVVIPVAIYLLITGALGEFWDQAILYNRATANFNIGRIIRGAIRGVEFLGQTNLPTVGIAGWGIIILIWIKGNSDSKKVSEQKNRKILSDCDLKPRSRGRLPGYLLGLAFIATPLEVIMTVGTREDFPHHFINWLPLLGLLVAIFAYTTSISFPFSKYQVKYIWPPTASALWVLIIMFSLSIAPLELYRDRYRTGWHNKPPRIEVVHAIERLTEADERVLIWGGAGDLLFSANRKTPARFLSLSPFFVEGYRSEELLDEYLNVAKASLPTLVIEGSGNGNFSEVQPFQNWVNLNYDFVETVGGYWHIYQYREHN